MSRAPMMTPSVCLQPRPGDRPRPKGSANAEMRTKSTPTPVTIHANTGLLMVASFVSTQSPNPLAAGVTGGSRQGTSCFPYFLTFPPETVKRRSPGASKDQEDAGDEQHPIQVARIPARTRDLEDRLASKPRPLLRT